MKKLFFSLVLCLLAVTASAQLKSVEGKFELRGDTGAGIGATIGLGETFEVAPSVSLYFPSVGTMFTAGADVHYLLSIPVEKLEVYPLVGAGFWHYNYDLANVDYSLNEFFVNVGAGARYHFHENWAAFAEEKYQIVKDYNDNFITIGISYCF